MRIVKNRDWQIDMDAMRQAVDGNTRLISVALVSNVNGYLADVTALSKLAPDHGAYIYVDIMQAAGCVPIDVKAMGIDFAACSTFKWLMGVKGFGFLYVRSDLQGTVPRAVPAHRRSFIQLPALEREFRPGWRRDLVFTVVRNRRVPGQLPLLRRGHLRAGEREIHPEPGGREHPQPCEGTDRAPAGGAAAARVRIDHPLGNESPIVAFVAPDPDGAMASCRNNDVHIAMRLGNKMRLSPSVYNSHRDIDRLFEALP